MKTQDLVQDKKDHAAIERVNASFDHRGFLTPSDSLQYPPMNKHLPSPVIVPCQNADLDTLLSKEWLLTNRLGAYASSSIIGCNTRRYHALLVAATLPPVGRICALSTVMEQLQIDGQVYFLASNEFSGAFSPRGYEHLVEYRHEVSPTFVYRVGGAELVKEIILARDSNAVAIRYTLKGKSGRLMLWPFVAMRDFHGLRHVYQPHQLTYDVTASGLAIQDRHQLKSPVLHIFSPEASLAPRPQWWYRFLYRQDIARGQDGNEDLYTPGPLTCDLSAGQSCQLNASIDEVIPVDFDKERAARRDRLTELAQSVGPEADSTTRRLAMAMDAYDVDRYFPNAPPSPTIVAGYHWFGDWGRDAFISLPGLLLTGQLERARGVFETFTRYMSEGMIANNFDDYSHQAHYNSIDASLWFVQAAQWYLDAGGDEEYWRKRLLPACHAVLEAYRKGTRFGIHADGDGLLMGGSELTQLTWMDAKLGDEAITPRHGKAVEINALWHSAHCILAEQCRATNAPLAERYSKHAKDIAKSFAATFWNESMQCLYDCITDGRGDTSIRPNQIFAVSLPHSPISESQQAAVVQTVREHLLTPYGLRTLSPTDSKYRCCYGNSWENRDRAYHQGTVWPWLIGPFIEAYLKVQQHTPFAVAQARQWLSAFDEHLSEAAIDQVSEIFDGDAPHAPKGTIAQAWSVAQLLKAKLLVR